MPLCQKTFPSCLYMSAVPGLVIKGFTFIIPAAFTQIQAGDSQYYSHEMLNAFAFDAVKGYLSRLQTIIYENTM
jgi:hypothetical protein